MSVVDSQNDLVAAAGDSVAVGSWRRVFDEVMTRIGVRFARSETRRTVGELLLGLLAPVERKNGWWLAEYAGHGKVRGGLVPRIVLDMAGAALMSADRWLWAVVFVAS